MLAMQTLAAGLERLFREYEAVKDVLHHHGEVVAGLGWIYACLVQIVPTPTTDSGLFHRMLWNATHLMAGNWKLWGKQKPAFSREEVAARLRVELPRGDKVKQ